MSDPFGMEPLDYAVPASVGARTPSIPAFIAVTGPTIFVLVITLFVAPIMERLFMDFKLELPLISKMLFEISHVMRLKFGWLILIIISGGAATVYSGLVPRPVEPMIRRRHRKWAFRLSFFVCALLAVYSILALFLPYANLLQSIGGAKQ